MTFCLFAYIHKQEDAIISWGEFIMYTSIKVVGFILATTGLAYAVKKVMSQKENRSGWHKIKVEEEKRTGTRYGSNPVNY